MSVSAALFTLAVASGLNLQPINDRCDQAAEAFGKADANGDGVITKAEVTELREDAFSRLDRNGDGYAEPADAPRRFRSRYEERFAPLRDQYDTDGDGRLSSAEFLDAPTKQFDLADQNGDGQLDSSELQGQRDGNCETARYSAPSLTASRFAGYTLTSSPTFGLRLDGHYAHNLREDDWLTTQTTAHWADPLSLNGYVSGPAGQLYDASQVWRAQVTFTDESEAWFVRGYVDNLLSDDRALSTLSPTLRIADASSVDSQSFGIAFGAKF